MSIRTAESSVTIDGVVERYLRNPVVKVTATGHASLPEISRVLPAASGYALHPAFNVRAEGPAEKLALHLDVKSEAGKVRGDVTADVEAPDFAIRGDVDVERLNLAPILKNPAQRTDLTGRAALDLRVASPRRSREAALSENDGTSEPFLDRMSGTFRFQGPHVTAAGYTATNVRVSGGFSDGRISLDGRAAAYGGTATAKGFVAPPAAGRSLAFDLRGAAEGLDLQKPASRDGSAQARDGALGRRVSRLGSEREHQGECAAEPVERRRGNGRARDDG